MATRVCLAAKAASAARTEQLSFLCHEIRNPLNGVIGYITFLEETNMNEEQQELVKTTQQCCRQVQGLGFRV
jgi:two-component system sensor histidine kinase/response regulator